MSHNKAFGFQDWSTGIQNLTNSTATAVDQGCQPHGCQPQIYQRERWFGKLSLEQGRDRIRGLPRWCENCHLCLFRCHCTMSSAWRCLIDPCHHIVGLLHTASLARVQDPLHHALRPCRHILGLHCHIPDPMWWRKAPTYSPGKAGL